MIKLEGGVEAGGVVKLQRDGEAGGGGEAGEGMMKLERDGEAGGGVILSCLPAPPPLTQAGMYSPVWWLRWSCAVLYTRDTRALQKEEGCLLNTVRSSHDVRLD